MVNESIEQVAIHVRIEIEAPITGPVSFFRIPTEMPLPNEGGSVAGLFEQLRKSDSIFVNPLPRISCVRDATAKFMHTGQQCRASRRAGGAHVEIIKSHSLVVHAVEVRCF